MSAIVSSITFLHYFLFCCGDDLHDGFFSPIALRMKSRRKIQGSFPGVMCSNPPPLPLVV